jgi:hypothetical protein
MARVCSRVDRLKRLTRNWQQQCQVRSCATVVLAIKCACTAFAKVGVLNGAFNSAIVQNYKIHSYPMFYLVSDPNVFALNHNTVL